MRVHLALSSVGEGEYSSLCCHFIHLPGKQVSPNVTILYVQQTKQARLLPELMGSVICSQLTLDEQKLLLCPLDPVDSDGNHG